MNNEPWLISMVVCVTLLASVCTCLLVPLRQRFSRIDPRYFRRIRVKFPSFLFVGIGNRKETGDVRNFGVIVPMFVLHIVGYLLTAALWAVVPVLYQYGVDLTELWIAPVAFALFHTVLVVTTEAICFHVGKKREYEQSVNAADKASEN